MKSLFATLLFCAAPLFAQPERALLRATQDDILQAARSGRVSNKDRERNDNAMHHLSEFDAKYSRGDFDKGKLDAAIDDLKNIVKNNRMGPQEHDRLLDDLQRLRDFRQHHG